MQPGRISKHAGGETVWNRHSLARRGVEATEGRNMKKSNLVLRLQPSLLEEARKLAEAEGIALNQWINVAVAEKLSALRTASYFAERAARGDISEALRILDRAGVSRPPVKGDELPDTGA